MTSYYIKPSMQRKRDFINSAKMSSGCSKCGYKDHPAALEFHHVRGIKRRGIAASYTYSWDNFIIELNKCEVICANCHNIEHYEKSRIGEND